MKHLIIELYVDWLSVIDVRKLRIAQSSPEISNFRGMYFVNSRSGWTFNLTVECNIHIHMYLIEMHYDLNEMLE